MRNTRVLRTAVFRASILYACLFSLVAGGALVFIYWSTASRFEQQTDARLRLETDVLMNVYRQQRFPRFSETLRRMNEEDGRSRIFFYQLIRPSGTARLLSMLPQGFEGRRSYATLPLGEVTRLGSSDQRRADDPVRVLVTTLPGGYRLVVGRDLNDQRELLSHTLGVVIAASLLIIMLALAGGALLGYRMVRRIDSVRRIAAEIIDGDLSKRMPVNTGSEEFDQLSLRLNDMLERIEQLMHGMREVTDNIAHDLRNPLNRLRNRLEVSLLETRSDEEYRNVLEAAIGDADVLIKTFNALLSIAQAESGIRRNDWDEVDLAAIARDVMELYSGVAEERGIDLDCPEPVLGAVCTIRGNRHLLAQAVSNLVDNAVKYTPSGGVVELEVGNAGGGVALSVTDSGPGIPAKDRARALERFARLDSARSTPGNGLGLSLVNAVARLHEARLILEDNSPGLRVTMRFAGYG